MSENNLVISIDAMGGDNSPRVVIEGLAIAARKNPDVRFLLFGDEAKIRASLGNYPQLQKVCEIRHSDAQGRLRCTQHTILCTALQVHT